MHVFNIIIDLEGSLEGKIIEPVPQYLKDGSAQYQ